MNKKCKNGIIEYFWIGFTYNQFNVYTLLIYTIIDNVCIYYLILTFMDITSLIIFYT